MDFEVNEAEAFAGDPSPGGAEVSLSDPSSSVTPPVEEAAPVEGAADTRPERPREVIRGIHPELLCQCPECEPDFVELQWFSADEPRKVKGDAMLFCARSSRKYFTPVLDLNAWISEKGGPRKARRGDN